MKHHSKICWVTGFSVMLIFVPLAFSIHCAVLSYPSHLLKKRCVKSVWFCDLHMWKMKVISDRGHWENAYKSNMWLFGLILKSKSAQVLWALGPLPGKGGRELLSPFVFSILYMPSYTPLHCIDSYLWTGYTSHIVLLATSINNKRKKLTCMIEV